MRLDAALGTAHRGCRFGDVHFLPVTHQKGFSLTRRQGLDLHFDGVQDLRAPGGVFGAFDGLAVGAAGKGLQQVEPAVLAVGLEVAQVGKQRIARFLTAKPVQRGVGQNALKQQGQLGGGLVAVVLGQLHHAVLHDVERRVFVAHMVERALERALFHAAQQIGEFLFGRQGRQSVQGARCARRRASAGAGAAKAGIIASASTGHWCAATFGRCRCHNARLQSKWQTGQRPAGFTVTRPWRLVSSPEAAPRGLARGTQGFSSEKFSKG